MRGSFYGLAVVVGVLVGSNFLAHPSGAQAGGFVTAIGYLSANAGELCSGERWQEYRSSSGVYLRSNVFANSTGTPVAFNADAEWYGGPSHTAVMVRFRSSGTQVYDITAGSGCTATLAASPFAGWWASAQTLEVGVPSAIPTQHPGPTATPVPQAQGVTVDQGDAIVNAQNRNEMYTAVGAAGVLALLASAVIKSVM